MIRKFETDWVNEGYPRFNFPAEWERFIALVPQEHRKDGTSIMAYYAKKMRSENKTVAKKHAIEWTLWEYALTSIAYDPTANETEITEDRNTLATALLETHYFMHGCFVPDNYIMDNLNKIRHIPCHVLHGRFDMCTPPIAAYDLARVYGNSLRLEWVNSGHLRTDPLMQQALKQATKELV